LIKSFIHYENNVAYPFYLTSLVDDLRLVKPSLFLCMR